jgi:hypothetical protein
LNPNPGTEDEEDASPVPASEDFLLRRRQGRKEVLQLHRQGGGHQQTHLVRASGVGMGLEGTRSGSAVE